MLNNFLMCAYLLVLLVGCSDAPPPNRALESTEPKEAANRMVASSKTITMFGTTWLPEGPYHQSGTLIPIMEGEICRSESEQARLLLLRRPENARHDWDRIVYIQRRNSAGQWVKDGPFEEWFIDGEHRLANYCMGELNGEYKAWHPNGQLHVRESYRHGKLNGLSERWYKNGQKQHESQYINDTEAAGQAWREDGALLD